MQKIFNHYNSFRYNPNKLRILFVKVSSHVDHVCRSESAKINQKLAIADHTNTLRPRIPENIVKSILFLNSRKSNLCSLCRPNISFVSTYCTSYALKPVDRGFQISHFLGFPDILTPTTPNLYIVLTSNMKLRLTI